MKDLTERQGKLFEFIKDFVRVNGFCPSTREMAEHMKITHGQGISDYLTALEKKGAIERVPGRMRAIRVLAMAGRLR